jgi:hypothetical protein
MNRENSQAARKPFLGAKPENFRFQDLFSGLGGVPSIYGSMSSCLGREGFRVVVPKTESR